MELAFQPTINQTNTKLLKSNTQKHTIETAIDTNRSSYALHIQNVEII